MGLGEALERFDLRNAQHGAMITHRVVIPCSTSRERSLAVNDNISPWELRYLRYRSQYAPHRSHLTRRAVLLADRTEIHPHREILMHRLPKRYPFQRLPGRP